MTAIATDGKGNYLTLDASGDWVPTSPPAQAPSASGAQDVTRSRSGSLADVITSPDALAADIPQSQTPTPPFSVTALRDKIRDLDMSAIRGLAPGPGASEPEKIMRQGLATGVHLGAGLLQTPLNMFIGMTQTPTLFGDNPDNAVTIDPETNRLGVTPEALQAGSLGARPLMFGGMPIGPPRNQMLLSAPTPKPPPPAPSPEAIPMPAPKLWYETAYDRGGQPPAPAFEPQVTMRQPDAASQPAAPDATVQPASVGAAGTPASSAAIPAPEAAAARAVAEKSKLLEQQQPGVSDLNQYVENSNPTVAQIEQTVNASREDKMLRNLNTDVSQEARQVADRNNTARQTHYADNAGSEYDVLAATQARDAQLNTDIASAFRNKGTADAQPVADLGRSILNGPDGKIDPVVRVVNNVMDKLRDRAGNLETDPETLWGVRKQINFLLSKEAAIENPSNATAARQLMQLRDAVDAAIEPAAPGFRAALKNYSDASRSIDAMELLQGRESKLYDSQNRMQYSKVQQMMKEAVAARHPDAPLNPWQSLSDDQMQKLWALRDDLRRSASAEDLARASGSDSVPNAIDIARQYAGVGLSSLPVLGPMAYRAKAALEPLLAARAARQQRARGMEMQYPDPQKYPLRNQMGP